MLLSNQMRQLPTSTSKDCHLQVGEIETSFLWSWMKDLLIISKLSFVLPTNGGSEKHSSSSTKPSPTLLDLRRGEVWEIEASMTKFFWRCGLQEDWSSTLQVSRGCHQLFWAVLWISKSPPKEMNSSLWGVWSNSGSDAGVDPFPSPFWWDLEWWWRGGERWRGVDGWGGRGGGLGVWVLWGSMFRNGSSRMERWRFCKTCW